MTSTLVGTIYRTRPAQFQMMDLPDDNWIGSIEAGGKVPYGWAGELTYPNTQGFELHWQMYGEMIDWIQTNVHNHRSNVLWTKIGDCIYIQFRKQRDMIWFSLRFGQ